MVDAYEDLEFAKLDISRKKRTGNNETIYCAGKTKEQLLKILQVFAKNKQSVLGTRCTPEQWDFVKDSNLPLLYDELSHVLELKFNETIKLNGKVAICSAGTADLPVAEESAKVAEFLGIEAVRYYDIGIAGLHRLLSKIEEIRNADIIISVAGMEGALPSVIAGLVDIPVIAVPTSVGYGACFNGLAPLLTMINSCAEGITVVNIDNGFGAAIAAYRMIKLKNKNI